MTAADRKRHVRQLEQEGYTILPEVLSHAEIERTRSAIDETLDGEAEIARKYGLPQPPDPADSRGRPASSCPASGDGI